VSWKVIPADLTEMINAPNTEKSERVMKTLLQMKKIDIQTLKQAYEGKVNSLEEFIFEII
jgi:hypothetical protein